MTEQQEKRIEELKRQWIEEIEKLPPIDIPHNCFNNNVNKPRLELEKKYREKIRQVMEEGTD